MDGAILVRTALVTAPKHISHFKQMQNVNIKIQNIFQ